MRMIDQKTLTTMKLNSWSNLFENSSAISRTSFNNLLDSVKTHSPVPIVGEKDIAIPLLLSMIVELKGEIEHLEDQLTLEQIRGKNA